jgi:hypothetical protein
VAASGAWSCVSIQLPIRTWQEDIVVLILWDLIFGGFAKTGPYITLTIKKRMKRNIVHSPFNILRKLYLIPTNCTCGENMHYHFVVCLLLVGELFDHLQREFIHKEIIC